MGRARATPSVSPTEVLLTRGDQMLLSCPAPSAPPGPAQPPSTTETRTCHLPLLPSPHHSEQRVSSCVTQARKFSRFCKSISLAVCCEITDSDPLARIQVCFRYELNSRSLGTNMTMQGLTPLYFASWYAEASLRAGSFR